MTKDELIEMLERRGLITTDPMRASECCGQRRDEDGFCTHREGHLIYVDPGRVPDVPELNVEPFSRATLNGTQWLLLGTNYTLAHDTDPARLELRYVRPMSRCACDRHRGDHSKCYAGCDLTGCRDLR